MPVYVYVSDGLCLGKIYKGAMTTHETDQKGDWMDAMILNNNAGIMPEQVEAFIICKDSGDWTNYTDVLDAARERFMEDEGIK